MTTERSAARAPKRRVHHFAMLKQRGKPIVMVTAWDYPTALAADAGGADAVLVGDSLGMVALGFESTIDVTLDMMVHHTAAVRRAVRNAFVIADLPFLSYKVSPEQALASAGRLVQEGGAEAVKMEGGAEIADAMAKVASAGIPVMGHLGLLPQSVNSLGGYRVQGRVEEQAHRLREDAKTLEKSGAFAIVLEAMDPEVAAEITAALEIPTIGIGAGRVCGGQVLVMSDLAGMLPAEPPKFAKRYANLAGLLESAVREYAGEVRSGQFPQQGHEY